MMNRTGRGFCFLNQFRCAQDVAPHVAPYLKLQMKYVVSSRLGVVASTKKDPPA
jgi:hypothetical protein